MSHTNLVQEHYTIAGMPARIERALAEAGLDSGQIEWSALAQFDQFHMRGLPATRELAEGLALTAGAHVLDVGSGLGGPARYLAAVHGCTVTGIDLTRDFVEIANWLTDRTGLADRVRFLQHDALALPFAPASFDHAWTQHVAMNIPDKEGLYRSIYRVLKPGGRLAIYDPVIGERQPVSYPVPWASEEHTSFITSLSEMRHALAAAGFREVSLVDTTDLALAWFSTAQRAAQAPAPANGLTVATIMGPDLAQTAANFARNIAEDRVRLVQLICQTAHS